MRSREMLTLRKFVSMRPSQVHPGDVFAMGAHQGGWLKRQHIPRRWMSSRKVLSARLRLLSLLAARDAGTRRRTQRVHFVRRVLPVEAQETC